MIRSKISCSRRSSLIESFGNLPFSSLYRYFKDQPFVSQGVSFEYLMLYYFEDSLKKMYFGFIKTIEQLSKDSLLHVKNKMVLYIYDLLSGKPEQEQNLLALLVNKLVHLVKRIKQNRGIKIRKLHQRLCFCFQTCFKFIPI